MNIKRLPSRQSFNVPIFNFYWYNKEKEIGCGDYGNEY